MRPLAQPRIILSPVAHRGWNWSLIAVLFGTVAVWAFIILCAAKAVR